MSAASTPVTTHDGNTLLEDRVGRRRGIRRGLLASIKNNTSSRYDLLTTRSSPQETRRGQQDQEGGDGREKVAMLRPYALQILVMVDRMGKRKQVIGSSCPVRTRPRGGVQVCVWCGGVLRRYERERGGRGCSPAAVTGCSRVGGDGSSGGASRGVGERESEREEKWWRGRKERGIRAF